MKTKVWNSLSAITAKGRRVMTETYWQDRIDVAGETLAGTNAKARIERVSVVTRVKSRVVRALYYREVSEPKYSVGVAIDAAAQEQAERFLTLADRLEAQDADFHFETIARLRTLARRVGRADR